jgi:hypothetical protein
MSDRDARLPVTARFDSAVGRRLDRLGSAVRSRADDPATGWIAPVLVGIILVAADVWLTILIENQWFLYDDVDYLTPSSGQNWALWLILPHNEHTILFTKLWFSLAYQVLGMGHYWIYAAPMILAHLAGCLAVYRLMRLLVRSKAVAIATIVPIAFMAGGANTLSWAGQFQYTGATAAGLWVLYCVFAPGIAPQTRTIWIIVLTVAGTLSGSAYLPLAVAAGIGLLSLGRYAIGLIAILVPSIWFGISQLFLVTPTGDGASSTSQVLSSGPYFFYALLDRAISDSFPVGASVTAAILVAAVVGAIAFLGLRPGGIAAGRARRLYALMALALALSLLITMMARLSRNLEASASGTYSYFILILAIPLAVTTVAGFFAVRRLATAVIVLGLLGWGAVGVIALRSDSDALSEATTTNRDLVEGAAYLSQTSFPVVDPAAPPSAVYAPTLSWSTVAARAAQGKLSPVEPPAEALDQLSLSLQWGAAPASGGTFTQCATVAPHESAQVPNDSRTVVLADAPTTVTLSYDTSAAVQSFAIEAVGTRLTSTAGRSAYITAGDTSVQICR